MRGWVKHFVDGTHELGLDHQVEARLASWSRGRLEGISHVEICHDDQTIVLAGPGEYWQSDTFETNFLDNNSKLVRRTLYRKFGNLDTYMCSDGHRQYKIITVGGFEIKHQPCSHLQYVNPRWTGKWLKLEMVIGEQPVFDVVDRPGGM